mgnify:CR=1 FL=1
MKEIDSIAINTLGIPGIVLMENAALQIAFKASSMLEGIENPQITVVAGNGNNGGDALAVTRHLLSMGYAVSIYAMSNVENLFGDAYINGQILINLGMDIPVINNEEALHGLKKSCLQSDLVIDGLFGTGLDRDIEGIWFQTINVINNNSSLILSIDIASGVDGLTGQIRGICVKAHATVTFYLPKVGMMQHPGVSQMGELSVVDIGIPYALADEYETPMLIDANHIREILPIRPEEGHKGTFGKLLIVAGSQGMTGAAYLSAMSAYRAGSGLVRIAVPQSCITPLSILIPEAVFTIIPENDLTRLQNLMQELISTADAVLIGPGLSCTDETMTLLDTVVNCCDKPMVIDADALNLISQNKSLLEKLRCEVIITPHAVEMSRLTGLSVSKIQNNRIEIAKSFADEYGLTVVLKGAGTIISANDGRIAINPTGNQGMATAGSGDVLAGAITSLLGQGLSPYDAAVAGTYIHGMAGDIATEEIGSAGVIASDIATCLPKALKYLNQGKTDFE